MIDGLGTDIIEIARIEAAMNRSPAFSKRLFTEAEVSYCSARGRPAQHFAGRFAAKEAVIKALGRAVPWREIEILNDERGKPVCTLHGKAREIAAGRRVLVSISHCETYSTAVAIALLEA
ncbi:MAG TPA: holo-ACP synthase [Armatimonadota bacterium]|jgi:holo-[acyl-carrier protein] synthase|nr:holo-ACP synthase [Armatimonadota bacterium]HOJ19977.1 holo-ACP synthase [Armatimonadota bacterium]HOM82090.1 holo-ACP synthase [Armatimonadota bacterium]HPO73412.1 holo-ACP synthase [Armatimonadota bacterium]HPT98755.1 holo-ACP synthase [Armatimonadota bacterium]